MLRVILRAGNAPFLVTAAAIVCIAFAVTRAMAASKSGGDLLERVNAADRAFFRAMVVLAFAYVIIYSYLSVHRYNKSLCGAWDLGIFESVLANALSGKFFQDYRGPFDHFDLGLMLYLPFYALWADARVLLVLQTAALAAAVWPLYLLAKEVSGRVVVASAVGILYLLHPFVGTGNLYDFHVLSLSPLCFFWMLYFMVKRRWRLYFLFMVLVVLVKESEAILVVGTGLYLIADRRYKVGAATALASLALGYLIVFIALPAVTGEAYRHAGRYEGVLGTMEWGLGSREGRVYAWAYAARMIAVAAFVLAPMGFLAARRWRALLFIIGPMFAANMLSKDGFQSILFGHYGLTAASAALGAAALATGGLRGFSDGEKPSTLPVFLVTVALLSNIFFSHPANGRYVFQSRYLRVDKSLNVMSMPIPLNRERLDFYRLLPRERFLLDMRDLFPRGSSVAAQNNIGYLFVDGYALKDLDSNVTADFYLFSPKSYDGFTDPDVYRGLLARLDSDARVTRFLRTRFSGEGAPDFIFYASGAKWLSFLENAREALAREPENPSYRRAAAEVGRALGGAPPQALPPRDPI